MGKRERRVEVLATVVDGMAGFGLHVKESPADVAKDVRRSARFGVQRRPIRLREVDPAEERVLKAAKRLFDSIVPTGPSENDRFLADVSRSACAAYSRAVAALSKKWKGVGR